MARIVAALAFLLLSCCGALAGCGSSNPNCVVPTAPPGTNNNQAASTAFVNAEPVSPGQLPPGVPTNTLITVTANRTLLPSDCGSTLQLGTGSTGFFTLTVPSVSGFAATCVIPIINGDTGRAKGVAGVLLGNGKAGVCGGSCLWPQQTSTLRIVNGAWTATNPGRWFAPTGVTCFVDAINGSDSNDCLASGSGGAMRGIENAIELIVYDQWDRTSESSPQVTIQLADSGGCGGTPYAGLHLPGNGVNSSGNAAIVLQGNAVTPTNTCIKDASQPGIAVFDGAQLEIKNLALAAPAGGFAILMDPGTIIRNEGGVVFSGTGGTGFDILQRGGATYINDSGYTIAGLSAYHVYQQGAYNSYTGPTGTVTCSGALNYTAFAFIQGPSQQFWQPTTFSGCGTVTGQKYNIGGLARLELDGVTLPGNVAGVAAGGSNIDAASPLTPSVGGTGTATPPSSAQIMIGTGGGVYAPQTVTGCTLTSGGALSCPAGAITVGTTTISGGTSGEVIYNNSGVVGQAPITFSSGNLGFGTETNPQSAFVWSQNATTGINAFTGFPGPITIGATSLATGWIAVSYANSSSNNLFRVDGSATAPSNLLSGEVIGNLSFSGWGAGAVQGGRARILANTTEAWTTTFGADLEFDTTAAGGSRAQAMLLKGGAIIGTGTTDPGAGGLSLNGTYADYGYSFQTPTTGFSITLGNNTWHTILDPAGTLATGTITMPSTPIDGMLVEVRSSQVVTALTVSANAGQSIKGQPSSFAVGGTFSCIFRAANTTWYC